MANQDNRFKRGLASCMTVVANIALFFATMFGSFVLSTGQVYSKTCASNLRKLTDSVALGDFFERLTKLCYSYVLPITLLVIALLLYGMTVVLLKTQSLEKIDISLFWAGGGTLVLGLSMKYVCYFLEGVIADYTFNEALSNRYAHVLITVSAVIVLLATACFLANEIIHRVRYAHSEKENANV